MFVLVITFFFLIKPLCFYSVLLHVFKSTVFLNKFSFTINPLKKKKKINLFKYLGIVRLISIAINLL